MTKYEKRYLKEFYTDIFDELDSYDNFIRDTIRTYVDHEEGPKYYYVSPSYKLKDSERVFRFFIRKTKINLRLEVRLYDSQPRETGSSYTDRIWLYTDVFRLKKLDVTKQRMIEIVDFVNHKNFLKKMGNDVGFARKMKMKKIKEKLNG